MSSKSEDLSLNPILYMPDKSSQPSPASSIDLGFDVERFLGVDEFASDESTEMSESRRVGRTREVDGKKKSEVNKENHLLCKNVNKAIVRHDLRGKIKFHVKLLDYEGIVLKVNPDVAIELMPTDLKEYLIKVRRKSPKKFQPLIERCEELLVLFKKND